jgi:hypothetical protein
LAGSRQSQAPLSAAGQRRPASRVASARTLGSLMQAFRQSAAKGCVAHFGSVLAARPRKQPRAIAAPAPSRALEPIARETTMLVSQARLRRSAAHCQHHGRSASEHSLAVGRTSVPFAGFTTRSTVASLRPAGSSSRSTQLPSASSRQQHRCHVSAQPLARERTPRGSPLCPGKLSVHHRSPGQSGLPRIAAQLAR